MMKRIFLLLFILPLWVIAQDKGIQFEHNTTWTNVKEKAKASNKHIFVDCFTTWCGPCKYMSNNIFPQEKVGDFFNTNFVSLKIQMDQTKNDNDDVKSWYDEAKRFEKEYEVRAYPTFLIFNPEGELVHRIVGGGEADDFIAKAKAGLNPETQYVTLKKKYTENPNDAQLAIKFASAAMLAYDEDLAMKALSNYIELEGEQAVLQKENIKLLLTAAQSSSSIAYEVIKNNPNKVDELVKDLNTTSNEILSSVLARELIYPHMGRDEYRPVNFDSIRNEIEKNHSYVDMSQAVINAKAQYYGFHKDWPAFKDAVNEAIRNNKQGTSPQSLNAYAWRIFENCDDPACIQAAINWSKISLEQSEDAAYLDTYANLLYKSGDKENAIKWQEKAIEKVTDSEKENYITTLDKMKKGEPTW